MAPASRFTGKVVLVTGATSGIGRACARALAAEGAHVAAAGRRVERLQALVAEVDAAGTGAVLALEGDKRDESTCMRWVEETRARFGGIDGLVNGAGVLAGGAAHETTRTEWDRHMDINLRAPFLMTRAAASSLIERRGAVVNISSVAGLRPYPNLAAYCVSKAALDQLTRCTALDLASHGVRVNAVNPGVVVTELHTVTNSVPDYAGFLERSKTTHPLGRVGQPEEVATLVLFLLSDEAGWITGGTYSIDGGRALASAR